MNGFSSATPFFVLERQHFVYQKTESPFQRYGMGLSVLQTARKYGAYDNSAFNESYNNHSPDPFPRKVSVADDRNRREISTAHSLATTTSP